MTCEGLSNIDGPIPPHPMYLNTNLSNLSSTRSNTTNCEGPTKLSGPIANHFDSPSKVVDYYVAPKVRNAGNANYQADKKGTGMGMLIALQGRAIPPQQKRRGMFDNDIPKNYINSNTAKIKQIMRKVKEREAAKDTSNTNTNTNAALYGPVAAPVKAFHKSERYKNVQSKVKESLNNTQPLAPRESHTFLRAHSRTGSVSNRPQSARASPKTNNAKNESEKKFASKDDFDFVKLNRNLASSVQIKKAPSVENLKQVQNKIEKDLEKYQKKNLGKVPNYIERRNEVIKKEQQEYWKNLPDPDCPPGHRKLPEDEKQNTLNSLMEAHKKMISEMNSLPIRCDTYRIQSTKSSYEKKLIELDEAIKIFSKPKVFVKTE